MTASISCTYIKDALDSPRAVAMEVAGMEMNWRELDGGEYK